VVQGLTLKPLLRALKLQDNDPVGQEVRAARARALTAGLASLDDEQSAVAKLVRQEFASHLDDESEAAATDDRTPSEHGELHRRALQAARQEVITMRANDEIGDNAFHQIEEELDWLEMAGRESR
jgi:monovalent cation/hydrogen antiporter